MKTVKPETRIVSLTAPTPDLYRQFEEYGAPIAENYRTPPEDLVLFGGKLCYQSFNADTSPNLNLTSVRDDIREYIGNLISVGHNSVLEHINVSVLFKGVSRILTHELVRHRHASVSQESGRYVRKAELEIVDPYLFSAPEDTRMKLLDAMHRVDSAYQSAMESIDWDSLSMYEKKELTSFLRRMLPNGMATDILVTANIHQWRHIFKMRVSVHAEKEINSVMAGLLSDMKSLMPDLFQDMELEYDEDKEKVFIVTGGADEA